MVFFESICPVCRHINVEEVVWDGDTPVTCAECGAKFTDDPASCDQWAGC